MVVDLDLAENARRVYLPKLQAALRGDHVAECAARTRDILPAFLPAGPVLSPVLLSLTQTVQLAVVAAASRFDEQLARRARSLPDWARAGLGYVLLARPPAPPVAT